MAQSRHDANDNLQYIRGSDGNHYEYKREAPDPLGSHPTYPPRFSSRGVDRWPHASPLPDVRQSPISFDAGAFESSSPSWDESDTVGYAGTHPETGRRASQSSSRRNHQSREVGTHDDHSAAGYHNPTGVSHNNYMNVRIDTEFTYSESYYPTEMSVTDGFATYAVQSQSGSGGPVSTRKNHVDYTKPEYDWGGQPLPSSASTTGGSARQSSKGLRKKKSVLSLFGK